VHELAIAGHVVDIAARHADGRKVTKALEEVPAAGLCRDCGTESHLKTFPLQCQSCGGLDLEITQGEELYVESLEMEEARTKT
jgi:Zn finger protein HypA/HybF involved in hydrogenase expression